MQIVIIDWRKKFWHRSARKKVKPTDNQIRQKHTDSNGQTGTQTCKTRILAY